jgi:hypothetical protein
MAAGEQRDEHLLDDVILSDDDFPQLGEDLRAAFGDPLGAHNLIHFWRSNRNARASRFGSAACGSRLPWASTNA